MEEKSSPQIRRLKLPVSDKDSSDESSPLTARKCRTSESRLAWSRRIMWGAEKDCRDEYMEMGEIIEVAEEQQALILEALVVLSLHNTAIENKLNE